MAERIAGINEEAPHIVKRNFRLGVISGVAFELYKVILSTPLVMTWFLSELTQSNLIIGLLVPIDYGGWFFLQFLLSNYVGRRRRALPIYRRTATVRIAALGLMALTTFLIADRTVLLVIFLVLFSVHALATGVAGLPFLVVVLKTVPPRRRGMYFAWRRFLGGILGLAAGGLIAWVLSDRFPLGFPDNYAVLFTLGFVVVAIYIGSFCMIEEPEGVVDPERVGVIRQFRRAIALARGDSDYARYLWIRMLIAITGFATPFYTVFARRRLGAAEDMVGIYIMAMTLSALIANLACGMIGDRYGNRGLVRLMTLLSIVPPALAIGLPRAQIGLLPAALSFSLVFVFYGLQTSADVIGSYNYVMELAPPTERAIYIGFANGVAGLVLFASPLAGAIADAFGFLPLFVFAVACAIIAGYLSLGLDEPRSPQAQPAD
jgi:MFS family permease